MLLEIANDDAMTTGTDGTKLCLSYTADIIKQLSCATAEDEEFADWLIETLKGTIKEREDRAKLWKQFFTLRSSKEFCLRWQQYLESLKLTGEPLFYQHVTLALYEQLLCSKFRTADTASEVSAIQFTYEEENAIRYMGGYVIKKLKDKKCDVGFLVDTKNKTSLEAQSSDWINAVDRGGLVHITDSCFQLFLAIETVTRQKMKATNTVMNDTFLKFLNDMITCDSDVLFNWTLITGDESADEDILHAIINLWVTIRGFSFAKSIVEQYRIATKKRTAKSKGLRPKLFTDEFK